MASEIKVLLIGGTSHVGKSTLAARLASSLGWSTRSTDQLARHPGRPWRDDASPLPADVVAYYSEGTAEQRLESVLAHYRENVWPIAASLVRSHLRNRYDPSLVLEGSALLPEPVGAAAFARCEALWLTAPDEQVRARILESSRFAERSPAEKQWIEAFAERAIRLNQLVVEAVDRLGLRRVDVSETDVAAELLSRHGDAAGGV